VSSVTRPESEDRLPTLDGRALSFGFELTSADILAESLVALAPAEARRHLFAGLDATLGQRIGGGDVIVAEELSGSARTAHPALAALAAAGVTAIVARRMDAAVTAAAHTQNLVTLLVDTPSFLHTDDRVRLDLDAAKIVNLSSGDRVAIRNLDDDERARLRVALVQRPAR
jgi:3-isopropylmalate dehydratase small subunit